MPINETESQRKLRHLQHEYSVMIESNIPPNVDPAQTEAQNAWLDNRDTGRRRVFTGCVVPGIIWFVEQGLLASLMIGGSNELQTLLTQNFLAAEAVTVAIAYVPTALGGILGNARKH